MNTISKPAAIDNAESQARAQLASIVEMVAALETEDDNEREEAQQAIQEDPLSIQVRGGWHNPSEESEAGEFEILLCTGGPACRIIGGLGDCMQPERPRLQYQDWGTPWTELVSISSEEREALLTYCQQFYFGE